MAGAVVVVDVVVKSRNLPLLTLSRHQSAFGFFLRKNMTLLFQPMMMKKKHILVLFFCLRMHGTQGGL